VGDDEMAAPGISVEVADVDAVYAKAVEQGLEVAYRLRARNGSATLHASRAERNDRQRPVPPLALSTGPETTSSVIQRRSDWLGRLR
jgi:hypothetical protein